jgi:hypothetical protein
MEALIRLVSRSPERSVISPARGNAMAEDEGKTKKEIVPANLSAKREVEKVM